MINEQEECRHGMPISGRCKKCTKEEKAACRLSLFLMVLLAVLIGAMSYIGEL